MVKRANKKQRNKINRKQKKLIIVGTEGKNVTEKQYLKHFNTINKEHRIIFAKGNATDSMGVVLDTEKTIQAFDLDREFGDKVYCLIDSDYGKEREKELRKVIDLAKKKDIRVAISNPTFEIWFLLHFRYSTKSYINNNELLNELKNYIPEYHKSKDVFMNLFQKTPKAIENSAKLENYHDKNCNFDIMQRCPSTQLPELVEVLMENH